MSQTITIFSPKGGVGRTFIATNLSACLAMKIGDKRVVLVDLDLQLPGDILKLLDIKPHHAAIDLLAEWKTTGKLTFDQAKDCILHHEASGVDFLPFIMNLRQRRDVDAEFIDALLRELGKFYEFIIIDGGSSITKALLSTLGNSNLILFIANPDVLSVSQVKEVLEILQSFSFPLRMMKVVLNRAESQGGVALSEVRQALLPEIICRIPSDGKAVALALNRRHPLVLDNPRAISARAIASLADTLLGHPEYFVSHQDLEKIIGIHYSHGESAAVPAEEQQPGLSFSSSRESVQVGKRFSREDKIILLKQQIHLRLIQDLDLNRLDIVANDPTKLRELREKIKKSVSNALAEETNSLIPSLKEREAFIKEIMDEAIGLGPLEDLISDQEVTDILVNNKDQIYVERKGKLELTNKRFLSNQQVRQIIERIVAPLGRRIDESVPMVDGRLSDGSRVNAIIPPLSLTGPTLTIRKFAQKRLMVEDLVALGSLNYVMGEFIKGAVGARKNIIVSGGTGSGKTTVLNVLSEFIPDGERIVTIEDAAELKLHHEHWVRLESRPPNIEGKGSIGIRELFRNSLRMRPDRIIIGECRSLETLDMLQAMNTGHDGSMTTLHANSTQDVLSRLDSLILMGGIEIPLRAIREMIASAIDIIVHTARMADGTRKITQVSEITGMLDEMHIGLKDIFMFTQTGISPEGKIVGTYGPTGYVPVAYQDILNRGFKLPEDIFRPA